MRESIIGGGISEGHLSVNGEPHPIVLRKPFSPHPGIEVRDFTFTDGQKDAASGSELMIGPNRGTQTLCIREGVRVIDELKVGSGIFLALTPQGDVEKFFIHPYSGKRVVDYGKGWIVTWIAGKRSALIVEINRPPLQDGMKIEVKPGQDDADGIPIPRKYWRERKRLLRQAAYQEMIENIREKLSLDVSSESPLSLNKRIALWKNLIILLIKRKYGYDSLVNDSIINFERAKEVLRDEQNGKAGDQSRSEALTALFPESELIEAAVQGI